jgi:hypothetical protein
MLAGSRGSPRSPPRRSPPHRSLPHRSLPHRSLPRRSLPRRSLPHRSLPRRSPLRHRKKYPRSRQRLRASTGWACSGLRTGNPQGSSRTSPWRRSHRWRTRRSRRAACSSWGCREATRRRPRSCLRCRRIQRLPLPLGQVSRRVARSPPRWRSSRWRLRRHRARTKRLPASLGRGTFASGGSHDGRGFVGRSRIVSWRGCCSGQAVYPGGRAGGEEPPVWVKVCRGGLPWWFVWGIRS